MIKRLIEQKLVFNLGLSEEESSEVVPGSEDDDRHIAKSVEMADPAIEGNLDRTIDLE